VKPGEPDYSSPEQAERLSFAEIEIRLPTACSHPFCFRPGISKASSLVSSTIMLHNCNGAVSILPESVAQIVKNNLRLSSSKHLNFDPIPLNSARVLSQTKRTRLAFAIVA
jgi:hypothetical protein